LRDTVLCRGAIGKPVIHAVDFLADIEPGSILVCSRNDAGKLMSRYGPAASLAAFLCVVGYQSNSFDVTPAAWTWIKSSPRPGCGCGTLSSTRTAVAAEQPGASLSFFTPASRQPFWNQLLAC